MQINNIILKSAKNIVFNLELGLDWKVQLVNVKQLFTKIMCIIMSFTIILSITGCAKPQKKKKVIKKIIVVEEESDDILNLGESKETSGVEESKGTSLEEESDNINNPQQESESSNMNNSSSNNDTNEKDNTRRELYQAEEETEEYIEEKYESEYIKNIVSWDGPAGYTIIYSDMCPYSYNSARNLQAYFLKNFGVNLEIKKDTDSDVNLKEILVGNSNRYTSNLKENQFAVSLDGQKLIFEGGHFVMVEKAVDWFITEEFEIGKVNLLSGTAKDFAATIGGEYKYVWGDEFDGGSLDYYKWDDEFEPSTPPPSIVNLSGEEAVEAGAQAVENGRLKLRTVRYFNQTNVDAQYGVGRVNTTGKFAYLYGYAEIRARVAHQHGAWSSWWMRSGWCPELWLKTSGPDGKSFTYNEAPYIVEYDIFESFSSSSIVPNIHKWWNYVSGFNTTTNHNEYPLERNKYSFSPATAPYEYHTYGCLWTPEKMVMSVDGEEYMSFDLKNGFSELGEYEYNEYMGQPMNFVLTSTVFTPDLTSMDPSGKLVRNEDLPFEYYLDYIRVYQREADNGGYWSLNP